MSNRNKRYLKTTDINKAVVPPRAVLMIMMLGTALLVYCKYIFGNSYWIFYDIGSDTWNEYFPALTMLAEKIRSGDLSTWCMNWGTGVDLANNQSIICDPFNIPLVILYLVGGRWTMAYGLIYVHMAKCLLTGYITFLWLSEFKLDWNGRVIGAYVCAFNGFLVLWGQHYFFATACVFMILDIYLIEKTIRDQNKSVWMIISIAMTLATSLYTAFPIALACVAYLVLRLLSLVNVWNTKRIIRKLATIIIDVIVAVLISGIISLPAYYQLTEVSSRIGGQMSVPLFFDLATLGGIFTRFFSNNLLGIANNYIGPLNYYELSQLFFSCLGPSMLIIFFMEKIHRDEKRWLYLILAIIAGMMMLMPLGGAICNKFVTTATRYSYVYIPLMAYAIAWFFSNFRRLHKDTHIIVSCTTVVSAIMLCFIYIKHVRANTQDRSILDVYLTVIVICLLTFAVMIISDYKEKGKNRFIASAVFCIITFSVIADSAITSLIRLNITSDSTYTKNVEDTSQILRKIRTDDKELIRIEKTYDDSFYNDALLENYLGISYYNTTFSKYVQSFMTEVWPKTVNVGGNPGYVTFNADAENGGMASLFGIRYVLSKAPVSYCYSQIGNLADGIGVYKNENSMGLGRNYKKVMRQSDFAELTEVQRQKALETSLVLQDSDYELNRMNTVETPTAVKVFKGKNSSHMMIKAESSTPGYIFVPVTWDRGWRAKVNGHQVKLYRADIGFQAIKIQSGKNIVKLDYKQPLQREGIIATISGLLCIIVLLYLKRKRGISS